MSRIEDGRLLYKLSGYASCTCTPNTTAFTRMFLCLPIPAEVKAVENKAFYGDYTLIYVIIPYTVTAIGDCAFFGSCCLMEFVRTKLILRQMKVLFANFKADSIIVREGITTYHSSNCLIESATKTLLSVTLCAIPAGGSVTSVGKKAFYRND